MADYNQYQAPQSQVVADSEQEFAEMKFLGATGRIGRIRFLAYSTGINLIFSLVSGVLQGGVAAASGGNSEGGAAMIMIVGILLLIAQFVFYFMFAIKRAHDMNVSGWLSLILLIPLIGVLVFIFAPGTRGPNNYGPPPPPNTAGLYLLGLLLPIIAIIGILAAIAIPAYQGYINKANEMQQQGGTQYEQTQ